MIHKSPTRRNMSRPYNHPQSPALSSGISLSFGKRKNSVTPLATPVSVSSSQRSRHSSPSRSSAISSPTRTSSGSSSRGKSSDGLVNLDSVLQAGNTQHYRGTISVSIRIKPSESNAKNPWSIGDDDTIAHNDLGKFRFDNIFHPSSNNDQVYEEIGKPLIDKLFQGYNAIVFAYGMTGSGKTYTMSGTPDEAGLILLSVEQIFAQIIEASRENQSFAVKVSYLEIYNEKIYDLLNYQDFKPPTSNYGSFNSKVSQATGAELQIRDDSKHGVRVVGLTEQEANSTEDVMKWISMGNRNRRTGETDYNTRSSRSHAIVSITLTCTNLISGSESSSTLSLCDLAGSERAAGQHERRKEGAFINKSLLALGTVISKLSAGSTHTSSNFGNSHIPYRDSKLTRILQPALSGESIVTTICTIDTRLDAMSETVNTIRFASRAKNVSMTVKRNETETNHDREGLVNNLKRQIDEQQELIWELKRSQSVSNHESIKVVNPTLQSLRHENDALKDKLQHCERLLDKDDAAVHDEQFVEIVEMLPTAIGAMLESKIQGLESQLREHSRYSAQLEQRLQLFEGHIVPCEKSSRDEDLQQLLKEQEEEIIELRKGLTRKNKMLDALQSAKRLREGALRPLNNRENRVFEAVGIAKTLEN
ncbi:LANO_0H15830g1_1 [Lachancea nothofagi CBS 11611]|uniref:Kinesin-like protein n=1 Tax=Lachancea nothofagi CBS 11611 TaxID=1266666 RepID=A0A1G4KN16_9SACH|nr:LANO_0H15830g1_1 [Lachancea nothofagi CBS 11611]